MVLTVELVLILLAVLGLGVWGVVSGVRQSRRTAKSPVSPQVLSALAQPYRRLLGEAVAVQKDVAKQAANAPDALKRELSDLAARISLLVERALPRAQHGTHLVAYLLELTPDEPQHAQTKAAAATVEQELTAFVADLKTLRGKVYQVLTDATRLNTDSYLARDLDDALLEVTALEEAFGEVGLEQDKLSY